MDERAKRSGQTGHYPNGILQGVIDVGCQKALDFDPVERSPPLGVEVVLLEMDVNYAVVGTALVPKFEEETQLPLESEPKEHVEVPDWGGSWRVWVSPLREGV